MTDDGAETDLDLSHYERFKVQRLMPARVVQAIGDEGCTPCLRMLASATGGRLDGGLAAHLAGL